MIKGVGLALSSIAPSIANVFMYFLEGVAVRRRFSAPSFERFAYATEKNLSYKVVRLLRLKTSSTRNDFDEFGRGEFN